MLAKLAGLGDGHRSNVSALIFPLYLPWPDNVNPLMKLLCACPKSLSSRGNSLFSFRHVLALVLSAPVMATSHCLCSLFFLFHFLIIVLNFSQFSSIYIGNLFFSFSALSFTFVTASVQIETFDAIIWFQEFKTLRKHCENQCVNTKYL